jgi:hypothetical protein
MFAAVALTLASPVARAQGGADSIPPTVPLVPSAPIPLDASRLQPLTLTYAATLRNGDTTRVLGDRTIQIAPMNYGGTPAWLLLETRGAGENSLADSLVVARTQLEPIHWASTLGRSRIGAEFRSDSVFGVLSTPAGRRTMIGDLPGTALLTSSMTEAALSLYPLALNWRDSVLVAVTNAPRTLVLHAEVAVVGEARVTVPAGAFDCWIVTLTTEAGGPTYWVSKRDRVVVRSAQRVPESGGMLTYELARLGR